MVSHCANPNCSAQFRRLKTGRLFIAEPVRPLDNNRAKLQPKPQDFRWLCDDCCESVTISEDGKRIKIVVV